MWRSAGIHSAEPGPVSSKLPQAAAGSQSRDSQRRTLLPEGGQRCRGAPPGYSGRAQVAGAASAKPEQPSGAAGSQGSGSGWPRRESKVPYRGFAGASSISGRPSAPARGEQDGDCAPLNDGAAKKAWSGRTPAPPRRRAAIPDFARRATGSDCPPKAGIRRAKRRTRRPPRPHQRTSLASRASRRCRIAESRRRRRFAAAPPRHQMQDTRTLEASGAERDLLGASRGLRERLGLCSRRTRSKRSAIHRPGVSPANLGPARSRAWP